MRDCTQRHSPAPLDARTPRAPLETHGPPHTALQDLADVATPYSASLVTTQPVTHPLSRRSLVESYGCSVRSEIMMVAAETAVSPAAAAWFAAEKAAQSGMPGTSVVGVPTVRGVLAECGSVL